MARQLHVTTNAGKRQFAVNSGTRKFLYDACAGCCTFGYIRPRLCATGGLSGAVGEADEGHAWGILAAVEDVQGATFCLNNLCYYVPAVPDYWDPDKVPGTDFGVMNEYLGGDLRTDCDNCACMRIPGDPGGFWSPGITLDFTYTFGGSKTQTNVYADNNVQLATLSVVMEDVTLTPIDEAGGAVTMAGCTAPTTRFGATASVTVDYTYHDDNNGGGGPIDLAGSITYTATCGAQYSIGLGPWQYGVSYPPLVPQVTAWSGSGSSAAEAIDILVRLVGGMIHPRFAHGANTGDCNGMDPIHDVVDATYHDRDGATNAALGFDNIDDWTEDVTLTVDGNSCPCDATRTLYRKCEYVWDCLNATGTVRPLWQECRTAAVTHDWQDEADVQCVIRGGRKVKVFTKVEDLGPCPDPIPDINASLPAAPTVTDCTDCPAGAKCCWRFFAAYTAGGATWATYGTPVFLGCQRTKEFPAWRFYNGEPGACIFAKDVFDGDCNDATDCDPLTPPTAPDLPADGTTATSLGAPRCDDLLTCVRRITYSSEWSCEFSTWKGEELTDVPEYVPGSGICTTTAGSETWAITGSDPGTGDPIATIEINIPGVCDCSGGDTPFTPTDTEINDNRPSDPPFSGAGSCP